MKTKMKDRQRMKVQILTSNKNEGPDPKVKQNEGPHPNINKNEGPDPKRKQKWGRFSLEGGQWVGSEEGGVGGTKATIPRKTGRRKQTFGKQLHAMARHTKTKDTW